MEENKVDPNIDYRAYKQVLRAQKNPGRLSFIKSFDHGVLSISTDKLSFEDTAGNSFAIPFNEINCFIDKRYYLRVYIKNGDKWRFFPVTDEMRVSDSLIELSDKYGIAATAIGGALSEEQSLKAQKKLLKSETIALAGVASELVGIRTPIAEGAFVGGMFSMSIQGSKRALKAFAKVDSIVRALRERGVHVAVNKPSAGVWACYLWTDKKKLIISFFMNPVLVFLAVFGVLGSTVRPKSLIASKYGVLYYLIASLIISLVDRKILHYITRPYDKQD